MPPTLSSLDLSTFPNIYVLQAHVPVADLHDIEQHLIKSGAPLTYDICEAALVLGYVSKARRARFELHAGNVQFKPIGASDPPDAVFPAFESESSDLPPVKKRKLQPSETASTTDESTASEHEDSSTIASENDAEEAAEPLSQTNISQASTSQTIDSSPPPESLLRSDNRNSLVNRVKVVNLQWLKDSVQLGHPQDIQNYLVYEAELLPSQPVSQKPKAPASQLALAESGSEADSKIPIGSSRPGNIVDRAKAEADSTSKPRTYFSRAFKRDRVSDAVKRDFSNRSFTASMSQNSGPQRTRLLHQTTSEHDEDVSGNLPPMPEWVLQNQIYSCERATPLNSLNDAFIAQLKEIRTARLLTSDEIGVRAYSTSIASIAAYPYEIRSTGEILALPGCDQKIARLFHEWQTSPDHRIQATKDIAGDPVLKTLRLFSEIWGVGATTAREFFYEKKWRDLDDIVEFGWSGLSRVQQIGVKYYDEFLLQLPRAEVEAIAGIVKQHAQKVVDERIQCVIVGGYRRGKAESGDVDLILSHPEQSATAGLVDKVVRSLEQEGWITHTLTLNLTNTKRGQETLPYITNTKGAGFDTLDKALVVWQSQSYPNNNEGGDVQGKGVRNPNPHRRVDIIISPWRTVGCAVAGWTSGTTFQRDLRRYAKKVKGWKFDSSGVRERGSGKWIDLEGWANPRTRCQDPFEAEKRVFEGLGLQYREPWERCTG
ncbi:MAG: hypothetical protein Q9169_005258 [Polycauliona sp. 2 TL-2023]